MALKVSDLLDLATLDPVESRAVLDKVLTWKYEHAITTAKAFAGAGSAVILATLVPIIQPDADAPLLPETSAIVFASAGLAILTGGLFYVLATRKHRELLASHKLLEDLRSIAPFISLYRDKTST